MIFDWLNCWHLIPFQGIQVYIVKLRKLDDKAVADIKETIEIPVGSYEIKDFENYLIEVLELKVRKLSIKANNNTLKIYRKRYWVQ